MARNTIKLTNTAVKNAKAKDKEYKLNDGEGLKLRIRPNGSKTWLFDYYKPHTKTRTSIGFGSFPEVTLAAAREKKRIARTQISEDIDPKEFKDDLARKNKIAANNTLEVVASDWFDKKKKTIAETTAKSLWRNFEKHVFPKIGKRPIAKLSAPEVIQTLKALAAKGSLETVDKIAGNLNAVMKYAVNTGLIHANPLSGIRAAFDKPKVKHMPTLEPEELPQLMKTISYASIKLTTRCLIEFQLHCMCRPNEAAGATWSEIDFENKLWLIPDERMKRGKPHTIPLTPQVLEILERMKPISGHCEHIFPSDRQLTKGSNPETVNKALGRMGYKGRLVGHGLRSLASTTLNSLGFDGDVIEAALSHQDENKVRSAYNRSQYLERRRVLMAFWSEHIENAENSKVSSAFNVKQFKVVGE
ncbi:integrase domain-containing protein [Colwellia polaris]|jgi:integrase|uniref:integrase domain-containing protein n=1 Tax=Colwellia polaris TaxID=326537 RepID=UPI000A16CE22|nr:integrase domain-containing protein [Colwellia polaris]|tara:strand:+ start:201 stop:1448 length:1248 start_codon:yes stop_codon:yes gene_type:complete